MDAQWLQEVQKLKGKAAEFMGLFNRLLALESIARQDPAASSRWDRLMGLAVSIRDRISYVTGLIDNVFSWFNDQGSPPPATVQGLGNLGILWVPVAVIAAAVAAIAAWTSDAYVEVEQLEAVKDLIDQGVPPTDAYRLVRERQPGFIESIFQGIGNNFILFTALGLAAYYLPRYMKKGRR